MRIVADFREQLSFAFDHPKYSGTAVEVGTLKMSLQSAEGEQA